jgi:hypothetical protein
MSLLRNLAGTPQVGDKGVGNLSAKPTTHVEIRTFSRLIWDTDRRRPILSTGSPAWESHSYLQKGLVIHKLDLAITTNIYN